MMKKMISIILLVSLVLFVTSDAYCIRQQPSIMQDQNSFHEMEENEEACKKVTTDIMYPSKNDDLLYRKFSNGIELQYYSKVTVTKELMYDLFEQPDGVIILHNGELDGQLEFAGEDIDIDITESGNLCLLRNR